ncbi:MAG: response regulator [Bacteroidota bacterium]
MKKILLIEDNEDVRENTAEILELAGYDVLTAEHGKTGVELATQQIPDLIICDIMMPELDGYGVLHILSKKSDTSRIPFIFLTAKAEKSDFRKGMNLGADDYLTKPFEDTELLDAIEIRLKKSEFLQSDYAQNVEGLNDFYNDARVTKKLENLSKERRTKIFKKKNDVFLEGDLPNAVYFINKGKVKAYKTNEEGKELIINLYSEGEFFGYESLLEGVDYKESAMAMEETEVSIIPKDDFFTLIYENHDISRKFIEMLCNKVSDKEERLLNLAYSSVRQRTAEALLQLKDKYDPHNERKKLSVSRDDLAKMVGTATESVIRVLSEFKDENLIEINSGKISIIDAGKLEQVVIWNFAR